MGNDNMSNIHETQLYYTMYACAFYIVNLSSLYEQLVGKMIEIV